MSVGSSENQAEGFSRSPSMSPDGRFVAFSSDVSNLVADDTSRVADVFVRDRQTGTTERVSVSDSGIEGNNRSDDPSISADGRFVAFSSSASDLVPGDTSGAVDVFVRDRQAGTTERVSVDSNEASGLYDSDSPSTSADGRFVAFTSESPLAPDGSTGDDVFVRDRQAVTTERMSESSSGIEGNGDSRSPSVSAGGRFVAFTSGATNLVASDTNGYSDVFVHDQTTDVTVRVNVDSLGNQADREGDFFPSISGDGRFVDFASPASNLVAGDTNGAPDAFVRDLQSGTTERVSLSGSGNQGDSSSFTPSVSADGRFVAFDSAASNLVAGDTNGNRDIFVRDRYAANNIAPVARGDSYFTDEDQPVEIAAPGVLENDSDPDGVALTAIKVSDPPNGTAQLNSDGSLVYTPDPDFVGTDSFAYKANDGQADSDAATVEIAVRDATPPPAPAITGPPNNSYDTDGTVTLSGTAEPNSSVEVFEGSASRGTATTNSGGSWSKTLSGVSDGTHTYRARATDAAGNTSGFSNARTVVVDTTKPAVKTTSPAAGARNVLAGANVTATFSETMRPGTVNANTVTLVKKGTTRKVAAGVSYSASDKRAVLNPNANLTPGATYTATVTTGVKDAAGNALARNKTWTFTVRR